MLKKAESEAQKLINGNRKELQEMMEKAAEFEKYGLSTRILKIEEKMVDFKERTLDLLRELKSNKRITLDEREELFKLAKERLNFTIEMNRKVIDWIGQLGEEKLPIKASNSELAKHLIRESEGNRKVLLRLDNSPEILEYEARKELSKELMKAAKTRRFD